MKKTIKRNENQCKTQETEWKWRKTVENEGKQYKNERKLRKMKENNKKDKKQKKIPKKNKKNSQKKSEPYIYIHMCVCVSCKKLVHMQSQHRILHGLWRLDFRQVLEQEIFDPARQMLLQAAGPSTGQLGRWLMGAPPRKMDGWFISWKIPWKLGWFGGTPHFRKPPKVFSAAEAFGVGLGCSFFRRKMYENVSNCITKTVRIGWGNLPDNMEPQVWAECKGRPLRQATMAKHSATFV